MERLRSSTEWRAALREETIKEVLGNKKFTVTIDLHLGSAEYKVFTTDLTPEYVRFNMGE